MMEISRHLVDYYMRLVTAQWFAHFPAPPQILSEYSFGVEQMRHHAAVFGELDALRLGIEYLLSRKDVSCVGLGGADYPYTDSQIRDILQFAYDVIWPDAKPLPASGPRGVTLVDIPVQEWRNRRKSLDS
jgi:hypothetical protein